MIEIPELAASFVFTPAGGDAEVGRVGMEYRDLIPDQLGGRYIASHIHVGDGGPVSDYVHHHGVRLQFIFCHRGWVDVVYQDQGDPFRMQAGDMVLQPPGIRHQVLESSAGCEVIELTSPGEHETFADPVVALPTDFVDPDRVFGGQVFARHRSDVAEWAPMDGDWAGWVQQDCGLGAATNGLAWVKRLRPGNVATQATFVAHNDECWFHYVRAGGATLLVPGEFDGAVAVDDSFVIPAGTGWRLHKCTPDFEVLLVRLPSVTEG